MGNKHAGSSTSNSTKSASNGNQLLQPQASRISRRGSELRVRTAAESLPNERSCQINGSSPFDTARQSSRRRWSSVASVNSRGNNMKPKRLLPRQCHLIIKSWNKKVPKNKMAKDVFTAIFTEAEELKVAFGIPQDVRGKKLRADPKFNAHSNLFTDTFDFVIRNLDDIGMVTENAEQLGRRHATLLPSESFRSEYWSIFTECIVEGATPSSEDKETQIAWRQLVMTLIYYMKLGYERETLRITRHASMKRSSSPMPRINIPNGE